jgi:protein gp37
MSTTKIEWTDKSWNPITGCTKISEGCRNCYADKMAKRLQGMKWTNKYANGFQPTFHEHALIEPMIWKKPCKIFVCSMGDLFHDDITFQQINAVFSVMSDIDRHTYIILTKRPENMLKFFAWKNRTFGRIPWQPKDNVWIGVSVENQQRANERIPLLLQIPSKIRFLSCEPLLGPIYLHHDHLTHHESFPIDWIIAGGESGMNARPLYSDWARSLQNQCEEYNIPFFFKGWGEWSNNSCFLNNQSKIVTETGKITSELESHIYDFDFMTKVGKRMAGCLIDDVEYKQFPAI